MSIVPVVSIAAAYFRDTDWYCLSEDGCIDGINCGLSLHLPKNCLRVSSKRHSSLSILYFTFHA